jgi:hypothetical protein
MKKAFLYLSCIIILFSCEKKKQPEPAPQKTTYQKSVWYSDSLNSYKFKTGTQWIYQKATTTYTDLVNVANTFISNCNYQPCGVHGIQPDTCVTYYGYSMEFHSNYYNVSTNITLFGNYITSMNQYCQNYPFFSCKYDAQWDTTYPKLYQQATNLTLTIGSSTFNRVVKMKCLNIAANGVMHAGYNLSATLYWCPNIGIVRKEIETSPGVIETWDLISYTIVM